MPIGIFKKNKEKELIEDFVSSYNTEVLKLATTQASLTKAQALTIFTAKGLSGAELDAAVKAATLSTTTQEAAASSTSLGMAFKGLGIQLKSLASGHPILLGIAAITTVVAGGISLWKKYGDTLENAKTKLDNAEKSFDEAKSKIEAVNTELGNTKKQISELLAKDKLTFVEKSELDRLRQTTKELRLQNDILEKEEAKNAADLGKDATHAFTKEFGDFSAAKSMSSTDNFTALDSIKDPSQLITTFAKLQDQYTKVLNSGDTDMAEAISETINRLTAKISNTDFSSSLSTLSEYKRPLLSIMDYRELNAEESTTLAQIEEWQKMIYSFTDPNTWNQIQLTDVFSTDGVEKSLDELKQLRKEGNLSEEDISGFEVLNSALSDCNLILNDGQTASAALLDELDALNETSKELAKTPPLPDLSELEDQTNHAIASHALLTTALQEQNETGTISQQTLAALQEHYANLSQVLEVTATGVQINTSKLAVLNAEEKENLQTDLSKKYDELAALYNETSYALAAYNTRLETDSTLTDEQRSRLNDLIAAKQQDRDTIMGQIGDLKYLQAEYANTTSKFNAFRSALSSPDAGNNYDFVQSSLKNVQDT